MWSLRTAQKVWSSRLFSPVCHEVNFFRVKALPDLRFSRNEPLLDNYGVIIMIQRKLKLPHRTLRSVGIHTSVTLFWLQLSINNLPADNQIWIFIRKWSIFIDMTGSDSVYWTFLDFCFYIKINPFQRLNFQMKNDGHVRVGFQMIF